MKIHYIQNDELATPGYIEEWANEKMHTLSRTQMYANETLPSVDQFDMLVILGGRMGAYEEDAFPWLIKEKEFIREAVDQGKWVLRICLGAQMLANALGGKVYPHVHKEIGWWQIEKIEDVGESRLFNGVPDSFTAFQFHGDTYDLPKGAVRLASNQGCTNQAFSYADRVLGLQFHPEFTGDVINRLEQIYGSEMPKGDFIQDSALWVNQERLLYGAKSLLFSVLDNFEAGILKPE
ncbi:type 1 glutamine amidotransferase [Bacillus sp. T33-2]|uniref:type 1 glutamine amidotransferase n=1 Tax=Bacillus sp. T33-2 TaxID=2054168 RepID=UPI000C77E0D1|nr:type 1 glutamine amidotransferase [Bacillus sp. T33-2]PLR98489.1 amidotransferase [Bacillus sp. T33-2]